jgi:hypothetical protein
VTLDHCYDILITADISKFLFLVTCVWPFALTPSATCVNVLTDLSNCGMVGHKCDTTSKTCSGGICQKTSILQLNQTNIIWHGAVNGLARWKIFRVTLPMNITLYNITTNNVSITTNGVSFLPLIQSF